MDGNSADAGTEHLWTALDVARYLQVSRATVYNLADRGDLPVSRIGALLRFLPSAVKEFAKAVPKAAPLVQLKQRKPGAGT